MLLLLMPFSFRAQSLPDYLEIAGENNLELKAAFTRYHAALERGGQKGRLPDLQVAFAAFVLPIETRIGPQQANIGLRQMFPWFGVRAAERSVELKNAVVKLRAFEQKKNELYFKVRRNYYLMHQLEKDIKATRENLLIMDSYIGLSKKEYEGGMNSMVDIVRVKMAINELGNRLAQLEDQRVVLRTRFNALLSRAASDAVEIPDSIAGIRQEVGYLRDSLWQHPAFAVYQAQKDALQEAEALNALMNRPKLSLGLNYILVGKRTDVAVPHNGRDALMPSLGISIPLNQKAQRARQQELAQLQQVVDFEKEARHQSLLADFAKVQADLKAAARRMALYANQIEQANQALGILIMSYAAGGTGMDEVLEMQIKRLEFQLALDKAQTDQLIHYARLRALVGSEGKF